VTSKRNQTTLRLPNELDEKLISLSKKYGVSKNAYILMVLSKEVLQKGNIA
jgi:predicted DNA-binding protein